MKNRCRDWIERKGENGVMPDHGRYLRSIIIFGVIFTVLQLSDIVLTINALNNPGIRELNPFYGQGWFVPVKLTMVFLIMYIMYRIPESSRRFAENAMAGMIFMYLFINMNNLYFLLVW